MAASAKAATPDKGLDELGRRTRGIAREFEAAVAAAKHYADREAERQEKWFDGHWPQAIRGFQGT